MATNLSVITEKKITQAQNAPRLNIISALVFAAFLATGLGLSLFFGNPVGVSVGTFIGIIAALSPRVAKEWERAVVLRLGRFTGLRGPGLFWILPLIDVIPVFVDQRIITTNFAAEQTLTADTV